jgi:hypothetical protein
MQTNQMISLKRELALLGLLALQPLLDLVLLCERRKVAALRGGDFRLH